MSSLAWALVALSLVAGAALGLVLGRWSRADLGAGTAGPQPEPVDPAAAEPPEPVDPVGALPRALENVPLGIVVAGPDGTVVYRNAMARRFIDGRHAQALVGSAVTELLAEADRPGRAERTLDLYGPPRQHLVVRATPVSDGIGPSGTLVIIDDVTDERRVDAVRRDFVANVSHELKTPVGAIGVLAEALRGEDDPDVVDRLAGRLQDEAMRLGHLVDDLLALSRIEAGELFQPTEVDLDDIVTAAVARNDSVAELRDVSVLARPSSEPVVVLGDVQQLVSAVGNLVDNAVKYSDPGSQVTVTVGLADDGRAVVDVADRGVGIPRADLERVFERFYRVDQARSRATGGTGLGLSIVRHVALNHGGEVRVTSAEGQGSTFSLLVPRSAGDRPGSSAPASAGTRVGA